MHAFLDWFRLDEFFPIVMIALILAFVGQQMTVKYAGIEQRAGWLSAAAFILYAGMGLRVWGIHDHTEVVLIAVRGMLASAVAFGIGSIGFAILFVLQTRFNELKQTLMKKNAVKPEPPPVEIIEIAPEPIPVPPPPPPPTREELAAAAREKYEERLAVINGSKLDPIADSAARLHAQQLYMQELDKALT